MVRSSALRPIARLGVEHLENRTTPAGNVAAFVSGGTVFLFGDGDNNHVTVEQNASGELIITADQETTVNGVKSINLGRGTPNGLYVDMGDGGDTLVVRNLFAGSIVLLGGNGNDSLALTNSAAAGNVEMYAGSGNDDVFLANVGAGNIIGLDGQGDFDRLHFESSGGNNGSFAFNFEAPF